MYWRMMSRSAGGLLFLCIAGTCIMLLTPFLGSGSQKDSINVSNKQIGAERKINLINRFNQLKKRKYKSIKKRNLINSQPAPDYKNGDGQIATGIKSNSDLYQKFKNYVEIASDIFIPGDDVLEKMTRKEIQWVYHTYVLTSQTTCTVNRIGNMGDGGWNICNDPKWKLETGKCLVYSFGINFDFSFDDAISRLGCEVQAFDPSMNTSPYLRGTSVHFNNEGVGAKFTVLHNMGSNTAQVHDQTWTVRSLGDHRRRLNHSPAQRQIDVIKMDVEGFEEETLTAALADGALDDVSQLVFETHLGTPPFHIPKKDPDPTHSDYVKLLRLLRRLYNKGFRIFHSQRNPGPIFNSQLSPGKIWSKCHEISMVNVNNRKEPGK